jgi:hypothetical protein
MDVGVAEVSVADEIKLVVGDDRPEVIITFSDDITRQAYDVSGAIVTVRFRMKGLPAVPPIPLTIIPCTLGPASNQARFDFTNGELDGIEPGHYEGEVIIDEGGEVQTVYDVINFRVRQNFLVP